MPDERSRTVPSLPPSSPVGSVRCQVRIACPAAAAWARIADAGTISDWFPGMSDSWMAGDTWERHIVMGTGVEVVEDVVNVDGVQRRLQYRIRPNFLIHEHVATVDVLDDGADACIVVYATEMTPRPLALAISGGTYDAIHELKRQLESEG